MNSKMMVSKLLTRNQHNTSIFAEVEFGPKGTLMDNSRLITIPEQTGQKLKWSEPPETVLVLKKSFGDNMFEPFIEVLFWLTYEKKLTVFVESKVLNPIFFKDERYDGIKNHLQTFNQDNEDLTDRIDLVICLGGDGTLMYAASLFQQSVPPVMSFHLGSLGFLAPFQFREFKEDITQVLEGNATLLLRSRLECIVCKAGTELSKKSDWKNILVLNEVVLDRGLSPYLCNLDLYVERHLVTSVQGDGIIISTPTGSTAYAVAAGASMMHPSVPSIMITPICPHSLSFRPIVVPAGVEIKLMVSKEARNTAWVSFDGRSRQELKVGDCVKIKTATHPVPSICCKDPIDDWFNSLAECLHWNVRKLQGGPSSTTSMASLNSDEIEFNHSS
ncbi:NAD kinase isoform X2 [Octopus bimaculoides]|uniref:NAD kinase isoform X2 n=1 Tax=Octopus bimaculoides TaxID=37653 RepID=UPI0022E5F9D0|nr:NAD kinase isoform X2 [Octopus bimaculoides]